MSTAIRNFVNESLDRDELIEGPILLADNVRIMTEGNSVIAKEEGPVVQEYNNVYCINTNQRIILASTGIFTSSKVKEQARTGLADGFWMERKGAKVSSEISHGFIFHAIKKGEIYNIQFDSGLKGQTSFFTAEAKPISGLLKVSAVLGFLLLLLGLIFSAIRIPGAASALLITFGAILLAVAIFMAIIKKLLFSSPVNITLENTSNLTAVIRNILEKSRSVTIENEKMNKETINYIYDEIYLKIQFNEIVTSKQLQDFVHILTVREISIPQYYKNQIIEKE